MAGVLACAAFNAQAEVSPWGFGVKGYGGVSSAVRYSDGVKIGGKKAQGNFFDAPAASGNIYLEYAFTDYVGIGLEVGYMRQGASLAGEKKEDDTSSATPSISMVSHGIVAVPRIFVYPCGREEGEGILKVAISVSPYFPLATAYKTNGQALSLTDDQKKEESKFLLDGSLSLEYEFSFGLSGALKYSYGFMNSFKTEQGKEQTIFKDVTGLKNMNTQNVTFGIGYNFASLLSE